MNALFLLSGIALGGALGWRFGIRRASAWVFQARAEMRREIRYWQDTAARATTEANRIAQEAESWAAGCKQGREEVISIVPLLIAAQQRPADTFPAVAEGQDGA